MDSSVSILDQPLLRWGLVLLVLVAVYKYVVEPRLNVGGGDRSLVDRLLGMALGDTWTRFQTDREVKALLGQENYLAAGVLLEEAGRDTEAIDAYMKGGELVAAATVWERRKKLEKAAELFAQGGEHRRAAEMLAKAGRPAKAAAILEAQGNKLDAAKLYADAGEAAKAGELYLDAGFPLRAAEVYEKSGEFVLAAECFQRHFNENVTYATGYSATAPSKDRATAQRAGRMWEKAGEAKKAVEIYAQGEYFADAADAASRAGDHRRAAAFYERAERLDAAAECWEAAGDAPKAAHLRGEVAFKDGRMDEAARFFVAAKDYLRAAELYETLEMWKEAGDAYRAGESYASAAGAYVRAERKDLAAAAYRDAGEYETAAGLFDEVGDSQQAAGLFEKAGLTYRSGVAAAEAGRHEEAITLLQRVEPDQESYAEATELLAKLFVQGGQPEPALGRLQRAIGGRPLGRDTLGLYYWLGRAHEAAGRRDEALATYQQILAEDLGYEDVSTRSQALASGATTGPMQDPRPRVPSSKDRIGKYRIVATLGRGAMGEVRRARDTVLERDVAIKVMTPAIAGEPHLKERFEREARAVAKLSHPNVVTIHDLGYGADGSPFIAMELLRGRDLRSALVEGALDLDAKLEIVAQVLAGLAHAHDAGIVHRDIKPANVFLQDDGTAKILDFGVARLGAAPITGTGAIVGTADYMSPEQVEGAPVDGRSDVFSVGSLLYEMLAGTRPFRGESNAVIFHQIKGVDPDMSLLPADAPGLGPILERALAKDPARRYQTAAEFAADVRALQMRRQSPGGRAESSWPPVAAANGKPPAPTPTAPGTDLPANRFTDVAEVGSGPCGRVRRARDTKHGRLVAVRTLPEELGAEASRLLVADLKTAAAVAHPNVARVLGVLDAGNHRHVLTELVEGRDCATPLQAGRRMSLAQVAGLGRTLAGALHAIHAKGLVHGSVQPSNIVFSGGAFKLTDLGLARLPHKHRASDYRAENDTGTDADLRAAVGVLYHLYTGTPPAASGVQPPGEIRKDTPEAFDRFVARGLAASRESRFASAEDLATALKALG